MVRALGMYRVITAKSGQIRMSATQVLFTLTMNPNSVLMNGGRIQTNTTFKYTLRVFKVTMISV